MSSGSPSIAARSSATVRRDNIAACSVGYRYTIVEIPARTEDEPRFVVVGMISGKHWSAVITYRGERVRLISVRRARVEEVAIYES